MPEGKGHGPGSPHITLTVKSTAGSFTDDFNRSNRAEKVQEEALRRFNLDRSATYVLRRETDQRVLTLSEKLEDLGLRDGDVVIIQATQAQDG
jgi:hypothetical protein